MIGKLNHVAIVVPDLAAATATYRDVLGGTVSDPIALPDHGATVVFVELPNTKIELVEPLGEAAGLRGFLEKNSRGGLHHVCYEVQDIQVAIEQMKSEGATIIGDGSPQIGAHGLPVIFLHPKDFCGTLIELEEVAA